MDYKKIMILGAGIFQLPAIRKAVDLGYYTITVDYLPDNIGHEISHQYINCSTIDKEGVLQAARELQIDGICTFSSDVAIPTVGYVCDHLGLRGFSEKTAEIMAKKHLFRNFQREKGFSYPHFAIVKTIDDVWKKSPEIVFPVVVKPVDTSGSRGIGKVEKWDEETIETAFHYARNFSRSGTVCIEEFLEGMETSGDGLLQDGRFIFIGMTHKRKQGFAISGHSLPCNLDLESQKRIIAALEECCQALGYRDGALDFDVMVSGERVTIIEMSPRNGGNGIPAVIQRATGVDLEVGTLRSVMGDDVDLPNEFNLLRGAGSFIFGSKKGGILKNIVDQERLIEEIPEVFEMQLSVQIGEEVLPLEHNGNAIGYVLFDCQDADDYNRLSQKVMQALRLEVVKQGY
jgi:biotin carboxylase